MRPFVFFSIVLVLACDAEPRRDAQQVQRRPVPGQAEVWGDAHDAASETNDAAVGSDAIDANHEIDEIDEIAVGPDGIDGTDGADTIETIDDVAVGSDVGDTTADTTGDTTPSPDTAAPPLGTTDDPIVIDRFPFVVDDDTRVAPSDVLDRYACAAATDESGPERVYRVELATAGTLVAEIAEGAGVDVDVHFLAVDPAGQGGASVACVARNNNRVVEAVTAGTWWLVVDTYVASGTPKPGAYTLAVELLVDDVWQEVAVAPGVVWKKKIYASYAGGRQTINTLDVDLTNPAVSMRPYRGGGCVRPSAVGPAQGAVAAVNGGFFDTGPGTCPPLDLIKIEGELVNTNKLTGAAQRAIGVDEDGAPVVAWVAAHEDWPDAWSAVGSYPSLVTDGAVRLEPDKDSDFFDGRHPRTAIGLTAAGHLLLVTVDGRGPHGAGMTLAALAQHMINLGAVQAVNLDGGGSTAMWIEGQSLTGVVNYPSDGDGERHAGERGVSDLVLIFSE